MKYLPTSPGLTKPELTLRQGTEAAVLIIFGASMIIMGDPLSNFERFSCNSFSSDESFEIDSHLTNANEIFGLCCSYFKLLLNFKNGFVMAQERDKDMLDFVLTL
jgi:hypothetical protein